MTEVLVRPSELSASRSADWLVATVPAGSVAASVTSNWIVI